MLTLEVVQIPASSMANFAYLVFCPKTGQAVVVDPSQQPQKVLAEAKSRQLKIVGLLNTHGHPDHVVGNPQILAATGAPLWAHPLALTPVDKPLADGDEIPLGEGSIRVLHTPGHTPGSVVFLTGDGIITGDTLFVGRCGRADLPGSDVNQLYDSLLRLRQLDARLKVYPGHDYGSRPVSTLGDELRENPFFNAPDRESFIRLRMG